MDEQDPPRWIVEQLRAGHERRDFDCGAPSLNDFLKKYATQFDKRDLGRTYVAIAPGDAHVLGFYALSSGSVSFDELPTTERRSLPSRIPIPVLHLGQLAVDLSLQGAGLGRFLLLDALSRGLKHSRSVAMRAVEVYAGDESARQFYQKYGFVELRDNRRHLYLSMMKVAKAFSQETPIPETLG